MASASDIISRLLEHNAEIIDALDAAYNTLATPGMSLNGRSKAAQLTSFVIWLYGKAKDVATVTAEFAAGQTTLTQVAMTTTLVAIGAAVVTYLVTNNDTTEDN